MNEGDVADLARLHRACLHDSLVGALGERYVRSFYRYVARSPKELTVVAREPSGRIVAAAVVSLEPASLNRRLLVHTSLAPSLVRRAVPLLRLAWSGWRRASAAGAGGPRHAESGLPEMILIYTSTEERGRGRGAALVHEAERLMRERGIFAYQVRTEADPSNRALAFYGKRGFVPGGISVRMGTAFQVFTRTVGPG